MRPARVAELVQQVLFYMGDLGSNPLANSLLSLSLSHRACLVRFTSPVWFAGYCIRSGVYPERTRKVEAKKQTFSTFEDLLENSEKPLLVDFYATWCGPCQFMVPILNEVGDSMKDKIQVVKIDTEKYPAIANKYNIQALPTFILFKDGEVCDRFEGALNAPQLMQRIEAALEVKQ